METTAANNGQKNKLALKSQDADADADADADGQDRRYWCRPNWKPKPRRTLLKLNSKEWSEPLAIYSCSKMQCKLCLPRETELAAYKYIDIALPQACGDKVNTYIIALVVKMKLWRFSKRFCTNEPKRQWCRVCNIVCENIVIVVLTMCDLALSVFCQKPNKSL